MPKSYRGNAKISSAKLKQLMKGKNVKLNGDGDADLDLEFGSLKDYNKYVKAMSSGKGFVLNHGKMKDIMHNGGSLKSVSNAFKRAGNDIQSGLKKSGLKSTVKEIGKNSLKLGAMGLSTFLTGDPTVGNVMMSDALADKAMSKAGLGIGNDLKRFGRNKDVKNFARGTRKVVKQVAKELKPIAKEMAKEMVNQAKADAGDKLRSEYLPGALDRVDKFTGNTKYGDILANSANSALMSQGMGLGGKGGKGGKGFKSMVSKAKQTVGGAVTAHAEAESSFGLGGQRLGKSPFYQGMDAKERMAYVRSHRKSGGSFKAPSGGSFKGL
ncbi:MAG: hypothetical protein RLZZ293_1373 [Pseudomonadota bacterium]|jgi:hypothetical protein